MADERDNLVLVDPSRIAERLTRIEDDMREGKSRSGALEGPNPVTPIVPAPPPRKR